MLRKIKCFLRIHKWIWRRYFRQSILDSVSLVRCVIVCKRCNKLKHPAWGEEPKDYKKLWVTEAPWEDMMDQVFIHEPRVNDEKTT